MSATSTLRALAARISPNLTADLAVTAKQAAHITARSAQVIHSAQLGATQAYLELAAEALADGDMDTLRLCLSRALLVQAAVDEHEAVSA